MIIGEKKGNILSSGEKHICFPVNAEGVNSCGTVGTIVYEYWPELGQIGKCELGTTITHERNGTFYHALVCYSIMGGWNNEKEIIESCFDQIHTDGEEELATLDIGAGISGQLCGANVKKIREGMMKSNKKIRIYA